MTTLSPHDARIFWKALVDNASALIADAQTLLTVESFGRARSLTVLAQEELGKALWIYDAFQWSWNSADNEPARSTGSPSTGRDHVQKFLEAFV